MNILETVRRWGKVIPGQEAQVGSGSSLTYFDLEKKSDALAAHLLVTLPDDHSPVLVKGHKESEMLVGFLGAVKSGHPYIPIDSSIPLIREEAIRMISKASLVLTPGTINELCQKPGINGIARTLRPIKPEDPWYIIFTSGSTGEPKGVVITRECLEDFVTWMVEEQCFNQEKEIFLNQAPYSFDLSVMDLYLSLATGGSLYNLTREEISEPRELFRSIGQSNATIWVSTPSFAKLCLMEGSFNKSLLPGVRKFLFCGETLPVEVVEGLIQRFPDSEVWNTYGPTEATCATTSLKITRSILSRYHPLPIGYPKKGSTIQICRADGSKADEDERGEIIIAGPNVSPGYLGKPELNEKAFFNFAGLRAYRTGDRGYFHKGLLFFDGREDHQIKLHGYRIELGDIEIHLEAIPIVQNAIVIPRMKNGHPDTLCAFVIINKRGTISDFELARSLKRDLEQSLPSYMIPRNFYFIDKFPLTSNGKVDRRGLAKQIR